MSERFVFPLETLLIRLEREGFSFGIDERLRMQEVLNTLGKEYIHQPQNLKHILAPVLINNQDEAQKFNWIFDEYYKKFIQPFVENQLEGKEIGIYDSSSLKVDPEVRRHVSFWGRRFPMIAGLVLGGIALVLFLFIELLLPYLEVSPEFKIYNLQEEGAEVLHEGTVHIGDTLLFQNTSTSIEFLENNFDFFFSMLGRKKAVFTWEMADDSTSGVGNYSYKYAFQEEGLFLIRHGISKETNVDTEIRRDTSSEHALRVVCRHKPKVKRFILDPEIPKEGETISFQAEIEGLDSAYTLLWFLDGEEVVGNSYSFEKAGYYPLNLSVFPNPLSQTPCSSSDTTFYVQVIQDEKPTLMEAMPMRKDPNGGKIYTYSFTYLASILPILFLFSLIFLTDRFRLKRRIKSILKKSNLNFLQNRAEPLQLPWPNIDYLLSANASLYSLAKLLRQRRSGEKKKLDIQRTIKATALSLGMLDFKYLTHDKASEYLVLIDKKHPQDHLARLFDRLVAMLKEEDVVLSCFYFDSDIRVCWNTDFPEGISFARLRQRFAHHRLLIYSDGYHMVDPYESTLKDWVPDTLAIWKKRAAIITPIPPKDWGYKERLLFPYFHPITADLSGQEELVSFFTSEKKPNFADYKGAALEQYEYGEESLLDYDFEQVEDLRIYLNDSLFEYLAATMVYPLPTWEMTLAIGRALSARPNSEYVLHYEELLRLSRIPWMQNGLLSPRLRKDLLATLSRETEHIARLAVLEILAQVEVRENSYAAKKLEIQKISNRFLTDPGDEEIARKMYALWKNEQLPDSTLVERMKKPLVQLEGDTAIQYLRTRFERITPSRSLFKAMAMAVLVMLGSLYVHDSWDKKEILETYSQDYKLDALGLTSKVEQLDSAVFYNNKGIEAFKNGQMLKARINFYNAIQFRHYQNQKEKNPDIQFASHKNNPFWEVELSTGQEPELKLRSFSVAMDEGFHHLDSLKNIEAFDNALLNSFIDKRRIQIDGQAVDTISFKDFQQFNAEPGMLTPYLFVKDYPIAGRNLLTLTIYNEGVTAFNELQFDSAAIHFARDARLLTGALIEVDTALLNPLYLKVLHGAGLSYYYAGKVELARSYLDSILLKSPDFFKGRDVARPDLEELFRTDFRGNFVPFEDTRAWEEAELRHTIESYNRYLDLFPNGVFASKARELVADFTQDLNGQQVRVDTALQSPRRSKGQYFLLYPEGKRNFNGIEKKRKDFENEFYKKDAIIKKNILRSYRYEFEKGLYVIPGENLVPFYEVKKFNKEGQRIMSFSYSENHKDNSTKDRIVLHFTSGQTLGDLKSFTREDYHISSPYVLGRDGTIYRLFSPKQWSYHLGRGVVGGNTVHSSRSISIQISNYGPLREDGKGNLVSLGGLIYCSLADKEAYVKLAKPFKGEEYFAAFTDQQYEGLIILLRYLTKEFNIQRKFLSTDFNLEERGEWGKIPRFSVFKDKTEADNFRGICSHINYRKSGKWDIGPAFNWYKVIDGVTAREFKPSLIPINR